MASSAEAMPEDNDSRAVRAHIYAAKGNHLVSSDGEELEIADPGNFPILIDAHRLNQEGAEPSTDLVLKPYRDYLANHPTGRKLTEALDKTAEEDEELYAQAQEHAELDSIRRLPRPVFQGLDASAALEAQTTQLTRAQEEDRQKRLMVFYRSFGSVALRLDPLLDPQLLRDPILGEKAA